MYTVELSTDNIPNVLREIINIRESNGLFHLLTCQWPSFHFSQCIARQPNLFPAGPKHQGFFLGVTQSLFLCRCVAE